MKKISLTQCVAPVLLLLCLKSSCAATHPTNEVFISTFPFANDTLFVACRKVMEEAYRRIGVKLHVLYMPGERSLFLANLGKTDGDLCRSKGRPEKQYKNLFMVNPPIITVEIVAFSTRKLDIESWNDLSQLVIGYERGVKVVEQNTQGMKVELSNDEVAGYKKLKEGHSDVFVDDKPSGLHVLKELGYLGIYVSPPLNVDTLHHYVHIKNRFLVNQLNDVLTQMNNTGETATIINSVMEKDSLPQYVYRREEQEPRKTQGASP